MCPLCWMSLILASCMFVGSVVTLVARDVVSWVIGGVGVLGAFAWKVMGWFSSEWPLYVVGALLALRIVYVVIGRRDLLTWQGYRSRASSIIKQVRGHFSTQQEEQGRDIGS